MDVNFIHYFDKVASAWMRCLIKGRSGKDDMKLEANGPNRQVRLKSVFSDKLKKKAVALAKKLNNVSEAARRLNIDQSNLYYWKKIDAHKRTSSDGRGKVLDKRAAHRKFYAPELKLKIVKEVIYSRAPASMTSIARDHGIPLQTVDNWVKAYGQDRLGQPLLLSGEEITCLNELVYRELRSLRVSQKKQGKSYPNEIYLLREIFRKLTVMRKMPE
jgi:transposase-like protein